MDQLEAKIQKISPWIPVYGIVEGPLQVLREVRQHLRDNTRFEGPDDSIVLLHAGYHSIVSLPVLMGVSNYVAMETQRLMPLIDAIYKSNNFLT